MEIEQKNEDQKFEDKKCKKYFQNPRETLKANKQLILDLLDEGICDLKKIIKKISKNGADRDKIIAKFSKKKDKYSQNISKYPEQFETLSQIISNNPKLIQKSLKKNNGGAQKAEEFINSKLEKCNHKYWKKDNSAYKEQIKFLVNQDIDRPFMILKALRQTQGDQYKALRLLKEENCDFSKKHCTDHHSKNRNSQEFEEKRQKRVEKREQRKTRHGQYKDQQPEDEILNQIKKLNIETLNDSIDTLYLDGNNLFYVNPLIRDIVLNNSNKIGQVEVIMTELIQQSSEAKKNIKRTILIFDYTKTVQKSEKFQVETAIPKYETSDDYLVELCEKEKDKKNLIKSLFVTSDVGLQGRLVQNGVKNLMKSGAYLSEVEKILTSPVFESIIKNN